ncbi:MAG: hypothetical protein D6726_12855, partial [Nitrospirae bacterium]
GEGGDIISLVQKIEGVDFLEAIAYLENDCIEPAPKRETKKKPEVPYPKAKEAETFYRAIKRTSNDVFVARFFKQKGLNIHPTIGAVEYKAMSGQHYIAIPCPTKDRVFGLECRGVNDDGTDTYRDGQKVRKTTGHKLPWVFKRKGSSCLITESIIDALAGEIYFGFDGTLIALNGVGNIKFLPTICEKNAFEIVYLALDNDQAGQDAQRKAVSILKNTVKVEIITDHHEAGVKDLHKLLELRLGGEDKKPKLKEVKAL